MPIPYLYLKIFAQNNRVMGNPFQELQEHIDRRFTAIESNIDGVGNMVKEMMGQRKYSVLELAEKTNTTPQTIRKFILQGEINAERFGRKYIIPHDEFEKACEKVKSLKYKR